MTLHFGWFLGNGFGPQGWGEPAFETEYDWRQPDMYEEAGRLLERCRFDFLVIEDSLVVPDTYRGSAEVPLREARFAPKHDPLALVPFLTRATSHLGVVATVSAAHTEPFTIARHLGTLQHFSRGRVGFNLVTSGSDLAAQNFGLDTQREHDLRYDRADEWVEVVQALWRSWDSDAILADSATGTYTDFTKVHPIHHVGKFYSVRGPLNIAPLVDGEPVLVQAGASGRGKRFAGTHGEVVIGLPGTPARMRAFRDGVRDEAIAAGRDPDAVKVLFMLSPIVTANDEQTRDVRRVRSVLTQEAIESELAMYSFFSVVDLGQFDLDAPLPAIETNSDIGTLEAFIASGPPGATLREILQARADADARYLIGTADEIADELERLAEESGADGFLFTGRVHGAHLHRVLDPLVPVLRRRGLLRTEYGASTLRANLADF